MRILLDVDGVLANVVDKILMDFKVLSGLQINYDQITDFDMNKFIPAHRVEDFKSLWSQKYFCAHIKPYPGAVKFVEQLRNLQHEVFFVTSPMITPYWHYERHKWLGENFQAKDSEIIFSSAKHLILGDYLLDDKLETVVKYQEHHSTDKAYLMDQPWNRHLENPNRVYSFQQLLDIIKAK